MSLVLRCAVYARFSSEKQSPLSIEDQVRKCREYAEPRGWSVLDSHIYSDEAIPGATDDRFVLRRLLAAASSQEKPFDVVLCDDTSRISRSLKDSFTIHDELCFADVRLIFVSQGIDTDSEQAEVLLPTHGIVDSLYMRELAKKTRRGVEGKALGGFHTGERCFGYRNVPINERYRGCVIWSKTVKVRAKSGKRIYKRTAADKWVVCENPEQRIVSDELWTSVQARIETVKQVYGEIGSKGGMKGRSVNSPYLFSGLMKCSECGANISIVSGRWRGRSDVVCGCPQNAFRGASVCGNGERVFRRRLEE